MADVSTMDIAEINAELDALTQSGQILDALDKFYADICSFQEGSDEPRVGRGAQRKHLENFFATLKSFNSATLHAQAVSENVTFSEWTFDMEGPEGPIVWNEILRREWQDGKVISERFYTAP